MVEYFKKIFEQIGDFFSELSIAKKIAVVLTLIGVTAGIVATFQWAGDQSYHTLMTNLNPEDSANVIRILRERNIPFRVDSGGKKIQIPPENVFDLRLELATLGLPQSSVVGYEIFDDQPLGTTSFVQKVNQKRALEGELMRTISTMKGVKRSRVHLVIPKKSAFVEDQSDPSASVVVDLEPGVRLTEKQVYGVGKLVAAAVEGLSVSSVVIVDSKGRTLSKNTRDPLVALTADQLDFQRKLEEDLQHRIEEVLEPVIGEGKVVAKVSAELDFSEVSETQTLYDPDGVALRSSTEDNQNMNGSRPGPFGRPGAVANQPGQAEQEQPNPNITTNTNKNKKLFNYEVPKTIRKTRKPLGIVKKLSVAVVVDGKTVQTTKEDGTVESKIELWAPEKIAEFQTIVSNTVGFDKKRGDVLEIKNIEFSRVDFKEADAMIEQRERRAYLMNLAGWVVIGTLIVLFFVFVVRPFVKWLTENTIDSVDTFLPQTIEELEKVQAAQNLAQLDEVVPALPDKIDPEKVEGEMIKEKIITLVDTNPHKAAMIVREWIRGEKNEDKEGGKDKTA